MDWLFGLKVLLVFIGVVAVGYALVFGPVLISDRFGDRWGVAAGVVVVAILVVLFGAAVGGTG